MLVFAQTVTINVIDGLITISFQLLELVAYAMGHYCCTILFSLLQSAILAIQKSRTLTSVERPSIATELYLVESHIDFTV